MQARQDRGGDDSMIVGNVMPVWTQEFVGRSVGNASTQARMWAPAVVGDPFTDLLVTLKVTAAMCWGIVLHRGEWNSLQAEGRESVRYEIPSAPGLSAPTSPCRSSRASPVTGTRRRPRG